MGRGGRCLEKDGFQASELTRAHLSHPPTLGRFSLSHPCTCAASPGWPTGLLCNSAVSSCAQHVGLLVKDWWAAALALLRSPSAARAETVVNMNIHNPGSKNQIPTQKDRKSQKNILFQLFSDCCIFVSFYIKSYLRFRIIRVRSVIK